MMRSIFGLIKDDPDPRDKPFHLAANVQHVVGQVDLSDRFPPAYHQGSLGTCTIQASAGMLQYLYPEAMPSVLQLYYEARKQGGFDVKQDSGSQIRDAMKVLQKIGAIPDEVWPYIPSNFDDPPPQWDGERMTIANYSRIDTVDSGLRCLTLQHPFVLAIDLPITFDGYAGQAGVLPVPLTKMEHIGLHAMLAVGHDTNFRNNAVCVQAIADGMDPAAFDDVAFLVRNSWGSHWGINGHFWMPERWLSNHSIAGDCWTGFKLFTTADSPQGSTVAGVPVHGTFKETT